MRVGRGRSCQRYWAGVEVPAIVLHGMHGAWMEGPAEQFQAHVCMHGWP